MTAPPRTGVLLMAYGTPERPEDVEAYYTHIRRGRPPQPDALADLKARYEAIGGISPLREITEAQARGLQAVLDESEPGRFEVVLGLKHAAPFVEDGVEALVDRGVAEAVGLVLAPHASTMSVGAYHRRARQAVAGRLEYLEVGAWYAHPAYLDLLAEGVRVARDRLPEDRREASHVSRSVGAAGGDELAIVLFTAHSLPARIVDDGDTYPVQLRETAALVTARLPRLRLRPLIAWQSAGRTDERWLGPDLLDVIPILAESHGVRSVVACPCGFVADHLEVLYDIDIEARRVAEAHGVVLERTPMPNDDPRFLAMLADLVRSHTLAAT